MRSAGARAGQGKGKAGWGRGSRRGGGRLEGGVEVSAPAVPGRLIGVNPAAAVSWRSPCESWAVEGIPEAFPNLGKLDAPERRWEARATNASCVAHPSLLTWMEFQTRECYKWRH